jgi:hypothetical protein
MGTGADQRNFWFRSVTFGKLSECHSSSQAENNNNPAVIELSELEVIIKIKWRTEWRVRFLDSNSEEIRQNMFTTAPRVYTLRPDARDQLAKKLQRGAQREATGILLRRWQKLLHNMDPRLTRDVKENYYWYRLKLKPEKEGVTFLWSDDEKYEDVIQLIPAGTPGVPTQHGDRGVITISHLRLRRGFQGSNHNQYCLDVSAPRMFYGPLTDGYNLELEGFWGQSTEPVSDFWKA